MIEEALQLSNFRCYIILYRRLAALPPLLFQSKPFLVQLILLGDYSNAAFFPLLDPLKHEFVSLTESEHLFSVCILYRRNNNSKELSSIYKYQLLPCMLC